MAAKAKIGQLSRAAGAADGGTVVEPTTAAFAAQQKVHPPRHPQTYAGVPAEELGRAAPSIVLSEECLLDAVHSMNRSAALYLQPRMLHCIA